MAKDHILSDSNASRIVDKKQSGKLWIRGLAWSRSLCVPAAPAPMDFSAWFEVYLQDRWWTFDARCNCPRFGRVLMATGPNASDVAMTTSFGRANLTYFSVVSEDLIQEISRPVSMVSILDGKALILPLPRENAGDLSNSAIPDSSKAESDVFL